MLSGGISARTARLNGTPSMAIRGGILSDENGRRSGAREVAAKLDLANAKALRQAPRGGGRVL